MCDRFCADENDGLTSLYFESKADIWLFCKRDTEEISLFNLHERARMGLVLLLLMRLYMRSVARLLFCSVTEVFIFVV